ncbi:MAG TPA: thioredoxin domain-containing protein [Vicinamibacteria bacterium]|nr:thioredoxin domain-containing protein [Vicinamibacteria bacterium]
MSLPPSRPPSPASRTLAILAVALAVGACSRSGRIPPPAGRTGARAASSADVVAEVEGAPILASDLEQKAARRLARVRQEEYELRRQALDELIAERLVAAEAAKRGLSTETLLAREVDDKVAVLSAADAQAIYEQNKARFSGMTPDQAVARIRQLMGDRAKAQRRAAWEKELRDAARVAVRLEAPRAVVAIPAGAPSTGPVDAPVTVVEFTDYQCPYCHRAQGVVDQLLQRYSGRIRFVHLDFPLDGHPGAVPAARAARCAGEQGKFWEYHRDLMTAPGTLDAADLERRAAALRLDRASFGACVASGRHDEAIQASFRQGDEIGVSGTPAYFVNGRMISGARPIESFTELIDEELARS